VVYSVPITGSAAPGITNIRCRLAGLTVDCAGVTVTVSGSQITFNFSAAITFPAANDGLVIEAIRVNASQAGGAGQSISATLSGVSSAPTTNPITFTNPVLQVGTVRSTAAAPGSGSNTAIPATGTAVASLAACVAPGLPGTLFSVAVQEGFPSAFTTTAQETTFAGLPVPTSGLTLEVIFTGVPVGVTLTPTNTTGSTGTLTFAALPAAQAQATAGTPLTFTFSFTATNLAAVETAQLNFGIGFASALPPGTAAGPITARIRIAPVPTGTPVVRFVDNTVVSEKIASLADCVTYLLFPWVVFTGTFDTGIAINNTTADVFGTPAQQGPVTMTCFRSPASPSDPVPGPSVLTGAPNIRAGESFTMLASTNLPAGFMGYCIAVARFQFAHGFAYIVDGFGLGAPRTSEAYLALIIPDPNITAGGVGVSGRLAIGSVFDGVLGTFAGEGLKH
jgi:hypothetical protein